MLSGFILLARKVGNVTYSNDCKSDIERLRREF
jgi:hypothetical protein